MSSTPYVLRIDELIGRSVAIHFRNIVPFTLLGAVVLIPWIALQIVYGERLTPGLSILLLFVQTVSNFVLMGALSFGVVQQLRGQPAPIGDVLGTGCRALPRVLGTGILCGLRIMLFSLLLLVPGIMEVTRLYVAIPAAVMEGKGGGRAVDRSYRLTQGSRWPLFGAWLLTIGISFGIAFLVGLIVVVGSDGTMREAFVRGADSQLPDIIAALLLTPFSATLGATAYFLLRSGKENIDTAKVAAVFD